MNKFRYFVAFLSDGTRLMLKAPAGKVSEQTARKYAQHWAKMQHGIDGVDFVKIEGYDKGSI